MPSVLQKQLRIRVILTCITPVFVLSCSAVLCGLVFHFDNDLRDYRLSSRVCYFNCQHHDLADNENLSLPANSRPEPENISGTLPKNSINTANGTMTTRLKSVYSFSGISTAELIQEEIDDFDVEFTKWAEHKGAGHRTVNKALLVVSSLILIALTVVYAWLVYSTKVTEKRILTLKSQVNSCWILSAKKYKTLNDRKIKSEELLIQVSVCEYMKVGV